MPGTFSTVFILAFDLDDREQVVPAFSARQVDNEAAALNEASRLANKHAGVVVWRRDGSPVVGEEGEAEVIFSCGRLGDFA